MTVGHMPCSFASTENYIVLMLWPCLFNPLKMLINKSLYSDLQWKPENDVKFYIVDKTKGGRGHVATYRYFTSILVRFRV